MSATTDVTIWCDIPGCSEWGQGDFATRTATEVRARLRAYGWDKRHGLDLCPEHAREVTDL